MRRDWSSSRMIDRDQLTEALADFDNPPNSTEAWEDDHRMGRSLRIIAEAARILLDFPTDEQVEAAAERLERILPWHLVDSRREIALSVLERVRDTMIGDNR